MSQIIHDPALTAIQEDVLLNCGGFIWECLAPIFSVPSCSYKYTVFDNSDAYKIPQTKLAGCAYPNEIECVTFETKSRETGEYFLDKYICNRDVNCFNANSCNGPRFDWVARQQQNLFNKLLLRHEYDVVSAAFDETKYKPYNAGDKVKNGQCVDMKDLGGQPHDPATNLLEIFQCLVADMYPRPTHAVLSRRLLNAFRRHPDFLGAGCVVSSMADQSVVEDFLGVKLCISDAVYDAAPFGAATQDIRCFLEDKLLFFTRTNGSVGIDCGDANFGWTAQWQNTFAGRIPCPKRGGRGGFYLRAGWDIDVHFNHSLGFLVKNIETKAPIAP